MEAEAPGLLMFSPGVLGAAFLIGNVGAIPAMVLAMGLTLAPPALPPAAPPHALVIRPLQGD